MGLEADLELTAIICYGGDIFLARLLPGGFVADLFAVVNERGFSRSFLCFHRPVSNEQALKNNTYL